MFQLIGRRKGHDLLYEGEKGGKEAGRGEGEKRVTEGDSLTCQIRSRRKRPTTKKLRMMY